MCLVSWYKLSVNCQVACKHVSLSRNHVLTLVVLHCFTSGTIKKNTSDGWDEPLRTSPRCRVLHRNPNVSALVSRQAPDWTRWHHLALSWWKIAARIQWLPVRRRWDETRSNICVLPAALLVYKRLFFVLEYFCVARLIFWESRQSSTWREIIF